jgi:RES domain-containing protein
LSISAWRIVKKKHQASAYTGEGARRFGGRWNSKGVAVIYTSATPSLAVLEILVHLRAPEILEAYLLAEVVFDEALVEDCPITQLPANWRKDPAPASLAIVGDQWVLRGSSAILRVPSAIIESECNYLINPADPDFAKCVRKKAKAFRFDSRLVK